MATRQDGNYLRRRKRKGMHTKKSTVKPGERRLGKLKRLFSLHELGREGAQVKPLVHGVRLAGEDLTEDRFSQQ